jgi:hypothetical protein
MLVSTYKSTRLNNAEDRHRHLHRRENLKSYIIRTYFKQSCMLHASVIPKYKWRALQLHHWISRLNARNDTSAFSVRLRILALDDGDYSFSVTYGDYESRESMYELISIETGPSRGSDSRSESQEFLLDLLNQYVHYCVYRSPPANPTLSQFNPVNTLPSLV